MENINFDFNNLLQEALKWINQNILTGAIGETVGALLKALGNLLIMLLNFVISIFQYLIGFIQQAMQHIK